ncbi:MAG: hypothetical protein WCA49_08910 [Candidatus Sulfotelmatobacter sp.]
MRDTSPSALGVPEQRGGAVLLSLKISILQRKAVKALSYVPFLLLVCLIPALAQKTEQKDSSPPKYDFHTETKTKGVVDEVNVLSFGTRKDFTELVVKSGDEKVHIYVCPKPFQEEMGISFSKGDEIAVTGSKVKHDTSDVILARELVKGTDTLLFRDDKGNPVWDWRTGK